MLKWWKLKYNCCPKCEKDFFKHGSMTEDILFCKCGFSIRMDKYKAVVDSMTQRGLDKELDQMEEERDYWE